MTTQQNSPANSQRACAGAKLGLGPASSGAVGPDLLCGRVTSQGDAVVLGKGHTLVHKCRRSSRARAALDCPGAGQRPRRGLRGRAAPSAWPPVPSLAPFQAHSDPPLPAAFLLALGNLEMSATLPCLPPTFSSTLDLCVHGLARYPPGLSPG